MYLHGEECCHLAQRPHHGPHNSRSKCKGDYSKAGACYKYHLATLKKEPNSNAPRECYHVHLELAEHGPIAY